MGLKKITIIVLLVLFGILCYGGGRKSIDSSEYTVFCGRTVLKNDVDRMVRYVSHYESKNRRFAKNRKSSAYGYFQVTRIARKQIGHKISRDSTHQVITFLAYMEHIHSYIFRYNLDRYKNISINGKPTTIEGLMIVGYVIGPYNLKRWLVNGRRLRFIPPNVRGANKHVNKKFINWG